VDDLARVGYSCGNNTARADYNFVGLNLELDTIVVAKPC
jgi:hypothetical protein